jgi:heterodisulfide reductase subunit A
MNVGVFVCECGDNIAGTLDVAALTEHACRLPGVKWAEHANYWCSTCGLERLRTVVAEERLERVILAGCAPRTHDRLMRRALDRVNPALINIVNLRDLCARPHRDDPSAAMAKARGQIAMAVADLAARQPVAPRRVSLTPHAVVIGGGLAGMTAALSLGEDGISVTLVERASELGGQARIHGDSEARAQVDRCLASIRARNTENLRVLVDTTLVDVEGTVGEYGLTLSSGETIKAGAIVIATGAQSSLDVPAPHLRHYVFLLCDLSPQDAAACMHACCLDALHQATEIKRHSPGAEVAVLFRELYTAGGTYDDLVWEAQQAGVKFIRYPAGKKPESVNGEILTHDELTGREVRVPCDQVISAAPMKPRADTARLAEMLRLPIDSNGFLPETRLCLRPDERIERGLYVCGAAHFPCDARRATFEAYSVAARAARYLRQGDIVNWLPAAVIDEARCNGCGDCARVCAFAAIQLTPRAQEGVSRRAVVDALLCTGCGNCVSVCPVQAAQVASATDEQIEAQVRAAVDNSGVARSSVSPTLLFACEWSGYSAAEIAGARGMTFSANTRVLRVRCTGRLQPGLLLKALEMGANGVMVLGCLPGACHYEQGNERAAAVLEQTERLASLMAMDHRLAVKWIPPDDGEQFVRVVTDFVEGHSSSSQKQP